MVWRVVPSAFVWCLEDAPAIAVKFVIRSHGVSFQKEKAGIGAGPIGSVVTVEVFVPSALDIGRYSGKNRRRAEQKRLYLWRDMMRGQRHDSVAHKQGACGNVY